MKDHTMLQPQISTTKLIKRRIRFWYVRFRAFFAEIIKWCPVITLGKNNQRIRVIIDSCGLFVGFEIEEENYSKIDFSARSCQSIGKIQRSMV